jgi:hypothetical protein
MFGQRLQLTSQIRFRKHFGFTEVYHFHHLTMQ